MKKILFILLINSFFCSIKTVAQTSIVPDTLAYLQTIVANKSQYIGQPFSSLLNSLQIQIKHFSPFGSIPHDKSKETSTSFAFYFSQSTDDHYLSYPRLKISWLPYLDNNQAHILYNQYDGHWVSAVAAYYSGGIIADIKVAE